MDWFIITDNLGRGSAKPFMKLLLEVRANRQTRVTFLSQVWKHHEVWLSARIQAGVYADAMRSC